MRTGRSYWLPLFSTGLLMACASHSLNIHEEEASARAVEGYIEDVNKLYVVDCLLPGQLRKLGSQMTYLSGRRPIRTTAADCEVRGGEYVAYDRSDYATALKVWLPKAEEGDATAQLYVGQVYEKGLGQPVDYPSAMKWYQKSAQQGNAQARISLGVLCEKNVVANNNLCAASDWYGQALGLPKDVPFVSAIEKTLREQITALTSELNTAREQLLAQRGELERSEATLRQSQKEVDKVRGQLTQQRSQSRTSLSPDAKAQALEATLREKEKTLATDQAKTQSLAASFEQELASLRGEVRTLRAQLNTTRQRWLDQQGALRESQEEVDTLRKALSQRQKALTPPVSSVPSQAQPTPSAVPKEDSKVRELETALRQSEQKLKAQQAKVDQMAASFEKERKQMEQALDTLKKVSPSPEHTPNVASTAPKIPALPPRSSPPPRVNTAAQESRAALEKLEKMLNEKMQEYQGNARALTAILSDAANSKDPVKRLDLERRKGELKKQSSEINLIKEQIEKLKIKVESMQLADSEFHIEIVNPVVPPTRGPRVLHIGPTIHDITGKVVPPEELQSVSINDRPITPDTSGTFHFLPQVQGNTPVKITATNKNNKVVSLELNLLPAAPIPPSQGVDVKPSAVSESGFSKGTLRFGKYYALIIGNSTYTAYPTLQTPLNDAKSLDIVLRERYGFTTKVLINANRYQMMTAFNEIHKKLTPEDNLLIYYAGHGEIDQKTEIAYWLPSDAEINNSANWISSKSITDLLSIMPARHILVVADSCYSGALTGTAVAGLPEGIDNSKREKWLKTMINHKARTVLTSGGVEPVLDEGSDGHSVFANAFLAVLRSNQNVLEDYNVFHRVAGPVKMASAKAGLEQSPQYAPLQYAGHEGSPFFFVPEK